MLLISACLQAQQAEISFADFRRADSVAALYPKHQLKDLKKLADKLTQPFVKQEDKFRAIYTWVCTNISNDYKLYLTIKRQRERQNSSPAEFNQWNKKMSRTVFDRLLNQRRTICTGYAYLIRELATHAGLLCVIVDGYGRTAKSNIKGEGIANHSWNAIKLNGKWYTYAMPLGRAERLTLRLVLLKSLMLSTSWPILHSLYVAIIR